jgi:tetratricopeptide (TPR) repeat protein/outer membrane biosynthesis protein TonB
MKAKLCALVASFVVGVIPAISAPAKVATLQDRLTRSEQFALGHSNSSLALEKRINALEIAIFGKTSQGTALARMAAIEKFLGEPALSSTAEKQSEKNQTSESKISTAVPSNEKSATTDVSSSKEKSTTTDVSSSKEKPATTDVSSSKEKPATTDVSSSKEKPATTDVSSKEKPATTESTASETRGTDSGSSASAATGDATRSTDSENEKASSGVVHGAVSQTVSDDHTPRVVPPSLASASGIAGREKTTLSLQKLPDDLMKQAFDSLGHEDTTTAARLFNEVVKRDPYNDMAFYQMGNIAARHGDIVDALRNYRIAFNMHPENEAYKQAVDVMERDIRTRIAPNYHICNYYPRQNDLCSLINQGVRFWGINAVAEAKLLFERVVSLDPNNIDGWFDLGIAEERQGNFRQALVNYRRALSLYQTPGSENLLGPEQRPQFDAMLPQVYKPFPPMLSSVVTSGEDKQYELGAQLLEAIAEVSKKAEHQKVGVGDVTDPPKNSKVVGAGKFFVKLGEGAIGTYLYGTAHRQLPGQVDTCDRCQIVRTRMMNPG